MYYGFSRRYSTERLGRLPTERAGKVKMLQAPLLLINVFSRYKKL